MLKTNKQLLRMSRIKLAIVVALTVCTLTDFAQDSLKVKELDEINYEAGVQQTDKLLTNRLVFFYREIKNGIDYNNITFKYFNFVRQIARGVEWELAVNRLHGFR